MLRWVRLLLAAQVAWSRRSALPGVALHGAAAGAGSSSAASPGAQVGRHHPERGPDPEGLRAARFAAGAAREVDSGGGGERLVRSARAARLSAALGVAPGVGLPGFRAAMAEAPSVGGVQCRDDAFPLAPGLLSRPVEGGLA
eukprot:10872938-Lingulodinium_polyedra.AAC.1